MSDYIQRKTLAPVWIVQRIQEHGEVVRTFEIPEEQAAELFKNWRENMKRYNDQSVSLIRVSRSDDMVAREFNTEFKSL